MGYYKPASAFSCISADGVIYTNDETKSTTSGSYIKIYEFRIKMQGKILIEFEMRDESGAPIWCNIRRNDVSVATLSTSSSSFRELKKYIDVSKNDKISIYIKTASGTPGYFRNLRVYGILSSSDLLEVLYEG